MIFNIPELLLLDECLTYLLFSVVANYGVCCDCFEDVVETCSVVCFLFQAVLWGWLALGWLYDHCAFGTAAAL